MIPESSDKDLLYMPTVISSVQVCVHDVVYELIGEISSSSEDESKASSSDELERYLLADPLNSDSQMAHWTVISPLVVPADLGHGTSTSGWVCFSILYMSLMCYSLYDAMIMRAHSSRTEGSWWLVVVLLVVFSFLLCLVSCCV